MALCLPIAVRGPHTDCPRSLLAKPGHGIIDKPRPCARRLAGP
ncbi:MAG: hypothetical protein ACK4IS_04230 [Erythrobacter sp.]